MILKLLSNTQMVQMILIKILKNTIQAKNEEHSLYLMIQLLICLLIKKKLNPKVTELFIRGRKLDIFLVFITQSYFPVLKNIRLNSTHYYENYKQKSTSTNKLHLIIYQISTFKDFMDLYQKFTAKTYSFWLLILLLHQIILHVPERIFQKEYKS